MTRSLEERLNDIQAAVTRCFAYRSALDSDDTRLMAFDAILRNLGVIGEAVKSLPDDFTAHHPDVPWPAIAGLRNVIVHEYFRIDTAVITDILDNHLSALESAVVPPRQSRAAD